MESVVQFDSCTEDGVCTRVLDTIKSRNLSNLLRIQDIMNVMDGRTYSLDEVQERIIRFYKKHVSLN